MADDGLFCSRSISRLERLQNPFVALHARRRKRDEIQDSPMYALEAIQQVAQSISQVMIVRSSSDLKMKLTVIMKPH